jgi:phosphoglycolate phosphatase (TIGR01487 family)
MTPPLALDIDGTLTTPDGVVDSRVFDLLPAWDAPVVLATGKAFPYPIALCHFVGIPETVVAENGGVVCVDDVIRFAGDRARAERVIETFEARGGDAGWGDADLANRWRETELIASTAADETLLREVAAEFEMAVVDTGYAYHVKTPGVETGDGLELVAVELGVDPETFVAVGDSENDASTFAVAGQSFAVANADPVARDAADVVLDAGYMDGTLAALESVRA